MEQRALQERMAEEEPLVENTDFVRPRIVRGRVDSLSLYEITDYELEVLEEGLPGSTYLTFGVFFLTTALSFLVALLTNTPASIRLFSVFVVVVTVGAAAGVVLLVLWYKTRARVTDVLDRIKARCSPQPVEAEGKRVRAEELDEAGVKRQQD